MSKRTNLKTWLVISVFLLGMVSTTLAGQIIFVDADASGANDGSSWADAYNYLQDALAAASSGDEIWAAQGIYKPDEGGGVTAGDRTATFQLKNGVAIYGGYAGFGEPNSNARHIDAYETILSGDLAGNDTAVADPADLWREPTRSDNSFTVVTGSGCDETAVLDGLTIARGNANVRGDLRAPSHCGAGIYNNSGSPTISNCVFIHNSSFLGGGIYNYHYSSPRVTKCNFTGNSALYDGGAMNNRDYSSPTVTNCTFIGNSAVHSVCGGMYNVSYSSPTVINCTFSNNARGGMYNADHSSPTVTNCIFTGNSTKWSSGAGMCNVSSSSPRVTNCIFTGSRNHYEGRGMMNSNSSSPTVTNCVFSGNWTYGIGGGMYNKSYCSPIVTNCTFSGNVAGAGGGIGNYYYCSPTVTNCIFWRDSPNEIYNAHNSLTLVSYSDVLGGFTGIGNIKTDPMFPEPGYWADANDPNIPVEPDDPNAIWVDGDYHLRPGSPCIDAGDNNSVPADTIDLDGDGNTTEPIPWDLDGNLRVVGGRIDMGAYEYPVSMIEVAMQFTPQALNPGSQGNWVKAHFVLPEGFGIGDVDANTPATIEPFGIESDYINVFINEDGLVEIEAAFSRAAFCGAVTDNGAVEVTVVGLLTSGQYFYGTDTIKIVTNGIKYLAVLSSYWLESDCGGPDWCGGVDLDQNTVVDLVDFALFDGCCIEVVKE
jgi:parallel beta-helix repeat protein